MAQSPVPSQSIRGEWWPANPPEPWLRHLERAAAERIAVVSVQRPRIGPERRVVTVRSSSTEATYRVLVTQSPTGPVVSCCCQGAQRGFRCKHAALALAACGLVAPVAPVLVVA